MEVSVKNKREKGTLVMMRVQRMTKSKEVRYAHVNLISGNRMIPVEVEKFVLKR